MSFLTLPLPTLSADLHNMTACLPVLLLTRWTPLHSGGLEMLFSDQRRHSLEIPAVNDKDGKRTNIAFLIDHLRRDVMKDEREHLFVLDNHLYVIP